jgi:hypothetical protein
MSDHRDFSDAYDEVIDEPRRAGDAASIAPNLDDFGAGNALNWMGQ